MKEKFVFQILKLLMKVGTLAKQKKESFIKEAGTKNKEIIWEVYAETEDLRKSDLSSHSLNYLGKPPRKKDNITRVNFMTRQNPRLSLEIALCSMKKSIIKRSIK